MRSFLRRIKKDTNQAIYHLRHRRQAQSYHLRHRRQAESILRSIERTNGKTDPKLISLCNEYAENTLGSKVYAPWLHVYSAISGSFKEGWIPDNYYGRVVVPVVSGEYGSISLLKTVSRTLLKSENFPDIAYGVNGVFYTSTHSPIPAASLQKHIFDCCSKVVFKSDGSGQGKGVYIFEESLFDIQSVLALGNGVFQTFIEQHEMFDRLMPDSVSTLRLTTLIAEDGVPSLRASYLRIGRGRDTHVQSESAIRVAIDLDTGAFAAQGYTTDWQAIERHPDTKIAFLGNTVPMFSQCAETVLQLHARYPYPRCIGWDVTVDKHNAIKVMEWNGTHNDIKFSEAVQGPCFADMRWELLWRKH